MFSGLGPFPLSGPPALSLLCAPDLSLERDGPTPSGAQAPEAGVAETKGVPEGYGFSVERRPRAGGGRGVSLAKGVSLAARE